MRWPWQRAHPKADVDEARKALENAVKLQEEQRTFWHPVLEVTEEARALMVRNHLSERLYHAYAAHPSPPPFNRRRDDPK